LTFTYRFGDYFFIISEPLILLTLNI